MWVRATETQFPAYTLRRYGDCGKIKMKFSKGGWRSYWLEDIEKYTCPRCQERLVPVAGKACVACRDRKVRLEMRACVQCGHEFPVSVYGSTTPRQKYCSKTCRQLRYQQRNQRTPTLESVQRELRKHIKTCRPPLLCRGAMEFDEEACPEYGRLIRLYRELKEKA